MRSLSFVHDLIIRWSSSTLQNVNNRDWSTVSIASRNRCFFICRGSAGFRTDCLFGERRSEPVLILNKVSERRTVLHALFGNFSQHCHPLAAEFQVSTFSLSFLKGRRRCDRLSREWSLLLRISVCSVWHVTHCHIKFGSQVTRILKLCTHFFIVPYHNFTDRPCTHECRALWRVPMVSSKHSENDPDFILDMSLQNLKRAKLSLSLNGLLLSVVFVTSSATSSLSTKCVGKYRVRRYRWVCRKNTIGCLETIRLLIIRTKFIFAFLEGLHHKFKEYTMGRTWRQNKNVYKIFYGKPLKRRFVCLLFH
jgi:hypothetical protein